MDSSQEGEKVVKPDTVFFTPWDPWCTEEEYSRDLTRPRKVHCFQYAVRWIHRGRAQEKTKRFVKRNRMQSITNSTMPPECVQREIAQFGDMTIYQRPSTIIAQRI